MRPVYVKHISSTSGRLLGKLLHQYRVILHGNGLNLPTCPIYTKHSPLPKVGESRTRGHRFTVRGWGGRRFNGKLKGNLSTSRMVGVLNELLEEVVEAASIAMFKKHLDMYMDRTSL